MVGWYDPRLLIRTGIEVAVSTIFGRHSDRRLIEALAAGKKEYYDYSADGDGKVVREEEEKPDPSDPKRSSIWIDYAGDVGDGWNSTYAVAYQIAKPHHLTETDKLKYKDESGKEYEIEKGDILIFGGDEVYPTASRDQYKTRLHTPYETALAKPEPPPKTAALPHVFAIPGNHDWYDSLVAFMRLFASERWFGGWLTRQNRSYFALKLPHGWWLLGTDLQLGSDIDAPQVEYFQWVAHQMSDDDRIILCHAEPHWIYASFYKELDPAYNESNLAFLERRLGKRVAVFIAGDLHHYRRHEFRDDASGEICQKITSGGGGAFLHATHSGRFGVRVHELEEARELDELRESIPVTPAQAKVPQSGTRRDARPRVFRLKKCFPGEEESLKVCRRNLFFPWNEGQTSWKFAFLTAGLYWLITLAFSLSYLSSSEPPSTFDPASILGTMLSTIAASPLTQLWMLLWLAILLMGFQLFTDTHSGRYRMIAGSLHALAHFLIAFLIAALAFATIAYLVSPGFLVFGPLALGEHVINLNFKPLLAWLLILGLGFLIGPFIMGLYLYISMNVFGRHSNEAFSSLAIQDWKQFLKMHIDRDGQLTIYPVGIRKVPRKWKERESQGGGPGLVPNDPNATEPFLIEPPVMLALSNATATRVTLATPKILKGETQ